MSAEAWIQTALFVLALLGILWRLAVMATKFETVAQQQAMQIRELKDEIKGLANVVTQMAIQTTRLDAMTERMVILEKGLNELRHGEGFVYPLMRPKPPNG